jgi:cyclase
MLQARVFPCLLLSGEGLVKTAQFKNPTYIGDPINAVRIFNAKQVDELLLLDINASQENKKRNISLIEKISDECAMPLTVGGGISSVEDIKELLNAGVEKVSINTAALKDIDFIKEASSMFGNQAIVGAMDVKRTWSGSYKVFGKRGKKKTSWDPVKYAKALEYAGAGEILINSIDQDGMMMGYDLALIKQITSSVNVPVIACGGCSSLEDIGAVIKEADASAACAGSFFLFHGNRKAVLISFPTQEELEKVLN